ncbi:hypothetical protein VPH35_056177 [Triticum aestivum]
MQFGIARSDLHVSVFEPGDFLIRFSDRRVRNTALSDTATLHIGRAVMRLSAWSRRVGATLIRLPYKIRVCLEGPPRHAWSIEGVKQLFPPPAIVDHIEEETYSDEESACCCAWVWVQDATKTATRGSLTVEEPPDQSSADFHRQLMEGSSNGAATRSCPVNLLVYPVLIHLDRVYDYTVQPKIDSGRSSISDISGIPSDDDGSPVYDDYAKWHYRWTLRFEDGTFPAHRTGRRPVHSRLNFGDRDDRGGSSGGNDRGKPGGGGSSRASGRRSSDGSHCDNAGDSFMRDSTSGDPGWQRCLGAPNGTAVNVAADDGAGRQHAHASTHVEGHLLHCPGEAALPVGLRAGLPDDLALLDAATPGMQIGNLVPTPLPEGQSAVAIPMSPVGTSVLPPSDPGMDDRALHAREAPSGLALVNSAIDPEVSDPCIAVGNQAKQSSLQPTNEARSSLGRPLLQPTSEAQGSLAPAMEDLISFGPPEIATSPEEIQLQCFVNSFTSLCPTPVLPTPPPTPLPQKHTLTDDQRRSGRLAGKPNYRLNSLTKAQSVLLKKNGQLPNDESPTTEADLQKYKDLYKRPVSSEFIAAVTSLVSSTGKPSSCAAASKAPRASAPGPAVQ